MDLTGKVAVVTGAASGIGRALVLRIAEEDVAGIVVADLDGGGAAAVAAEIGARAIGVTCDVGDDASNGALSAAAESAFGPVTLFCANAGIGGGGDLLSVSDDDWARAYAVNVDSHVYAARRLVPGWLERGEGYFLSTASAAGLFTQIGSAPYSVTKHAAVAFAEYLSIAYGNGGVRVSCLCPMGVNTPLLDGDGSKASAIATAVVRAAGNVMEPEQVADIVLQAIADERFLILPHLEVEEFFRRRGDDHERWLKGMRRLQRAVDERA